MNQFKSASNPPWFTGLAEAPQASASHSTGAKYGQDATPPSSSGGQPAVVPLFPWRWRRGAAALQSKVMIYSGWGRGWKGGAGGGWRERECCRRKGMMGKRSGIRRRAAAAAAGVKRQGKHMQAKRARLLHVWKNRHLEITTHPTCCQHTHRQHAGGYTARKETILRPPKVLEGYLKAKLSHGHY